METTTRKGHISMQAKPGVALWGCFAVGLEIFQGGLRGAAGAVIWVLLGLHCVIAQVGE